MTATARLALSAKSCGKTSRPLVASKRKSRKAKSKGCRLNAATAVCAEGTARTSHPIPSKHTERVVRIFFSSSMTNTRGSMFVFYNRKEKRSSECPDFFHEEIEKRPNVSNKALLSLRGFLQWRPILIMPGHLLYGDTRDWPKFSHRVTDRDQGVGRKKIWQA